VFDRQIAIINSMTKAERANPELLQRASGASASQRFRHRRSKINKLMKHAPPDGRHDEEGVEGRQGLGAGMFGGLMGGMASKMGLGGLPAASGVAWAACRICPRWTRSSSRHCRSRQEAAGNGLPGGLPDCRVAFPAFAGYGGLPGLGGAKLPGLGLPGLPEEEMSETVMSDTVKAKACCRQATAPRSTTSMRPSSTCSPSASAAPRQSAS
jgi:signal recognition particle subunit SRP54